AAARPDCLRSLAVLLGGAFSGARVVDVEVGLAVGIARHAEAVGLEAVVERALLAVGGEWLDGDLVLAGARRAAVGEQVVALGEAFDARRDLVERRADGGGIFRQRGAVTPDVAQLALV